jgi:hypothetical protein
MEQKYTSRVFSVSGLNLHAMHIHDGGDGELLFSSEIDGELFEHCKYGNFGP